MLDSYLISSQMCNEERVRVLAKRLRSPKAVPMLPPSQLPVASAFSASSARCVKGKSQTRRP